MQEPDDGRMMNMAEINRRLGFMLTTSYISDLGFDVVEVGRGKGFKASDFGAICDRLIEQIQQVKLKRFDPA